MKKLIYITFLNLFFINHVTAQCTEPDASIWKDTWVSCQQTVNPKAEYGNSHWIQYDFGSARNLSKTWVWNTNDPAKLNQGFNLVKIDYSKDGQNWTNWGEMNFPKAKGDAVYSGFSGPDLLNVKAQFVLITAISNHGHATCAGLAEIKFNLMPEDGGVVIPETEEEEETDEEDDFVCAEINQIMLEEVTATEAFLYWEFESEAEDNIFLFEYREEGGNAIIVELEDSEVFLEGLQSGTTYEYSVSILCGGEFIPSAIQTFQTLTCSSVNEVFVEEVSEFEAFIIWEGQSGQEFYLIEIGLVGQDEKIEFETEEAEVFLDELNPDTQYEIRVGTECGEEIVWSEPTQFRTVAVDLDLSTSVNSKLNLSTKQVHLFPNPTPGKLTIRIKASVKDVLNYAVSDLNGRTLFRNVTKLHSGTNDLKLDVSNLPDGTYWLYGVTLNQRASTHQQIIKISK